jgi:protoheme IX farnesyltransferase
VAGGVYGVGAVLLNTVFTGAAIQVYCDHGDRSARRMFALSLLYLLLIFSMLLLDHTRGALH